MAKIVLEVPLVTQGQNPICWVACTAMILSYKQRRSVTVGEINNGFDPSNSSMTNPATSWSVFYAILDDLGIESTGPAMSPAISYIHDILVVHGPFILTHLTRALAPTVTGVGTHAVVVTGIDTGTGQCFYNNPWGSKNTPVSAGTIQSAMEDLWQQNIRSVAYVA
jgi:uncharacterized protein YvpB